MYRLIAISIVATFSAQPLFAQTIQEFSAYWTDTISKECQPTQRAAPENSKLTDAQLAQYCGCIGRHSAEVVTMNEVFELSKTGQRPKSMQQKLNALGATCTEVVMGKTKDEPIKPR